MSDIAGVLRSCCWIVVIGDLWSMWNVLLVNNLLRCIKPTFFIALTLSPSPPWHTDLDLTVMIYSVNVPVSQVTGSLLKLAKTNHPEPWSSRWTVSFVWIDYGQLKDLYFENSMSVYLKSLQPNYLLLTFRLWTSPENRSYYRFSFCGICGCYFLSCVA